MSITIAKLLSRMSEQKYPFSLIEWDNPKQKPDDSGAAEDNSESAEKCINITISVDTDIPVKVNVIKTDSDKD